MINTGLVFQEVISWHRLNKTSKQEKTHNNPIVLIFYI